MTIFTVLLHPEKWKCDRKISLILMFTKSLFFLMKVEKRIWNSELEIGKSEIVLEVEASMFNKEKWIYSVLVKKHFYKLILGLCLIIHLTVYQPWKMNSGNLSEGWRQWFQSSTRQLRYIPWVLAFHVLKVNGAPSYLPLGFISVKSSLQDYSGCRAWER